MENQIVHRWFFHHPPATVWKYLTDAKLLESWLMPSDFKLQIGHRFTFSARPIPIFGFDGKIYCEVLDFEPLRHLSYAWRGGKGKDVKLDSVVTWTLTEREGGTELNLLHSGFVGMRNYFPYLVMNKGWQKILKRLSQKMES
ncbi:MAG: SRPBCC domain-containing protein [Pedobacter sp.]|nr:SRPBCC domain-containing protein [Pedobacter sp.]MDQ8051596.1 SRPBCC domain-containing protein [Pedobacter sp.]